MSRGILFDFDDTLVETTVFFNEAKKQFAGLMENFGVPPGEALDTLNRFDIANVKKYGGFLKQCFPEALGQTYEFYCRKNGRPYSEKMRKEIEDLGWWVFAQPVRPVPGAEEVLARLKPHFPLFLATKGDPVLQLKRVGESGLESWFKNIYVLEDKNRDIYRKIAAEQKLQPKASWMVGNSMKSDINPARMAGFNCIYICHPHTWDYEDEDPVGGHVCVEALHQVPQVVQLPQDAAFFPLPPGVPAAAKTVFSGGSHA
ncbi:MAG: HAD family hydrolase [Firmicutes bacterium]|nr:HAD family hydrolase [Bacillota bacterium]